MTEVVVVIAWIIATLAIGSFSGVIGKRWGVEYPITIMACLIVIANVLSSKIVSFGSFTIPAGTLVFSVSFLVTDILSEKWGKKYARKAVWAGFYGNIILIIAVWIAINWEAAPFAMDFAKSYKEVLGLTPRIAIASVITYLVSQHHDVWAFHFWKDLTRGKHLWFRNNASTIVSQLIDSVLFITLAFYGVFPILPLILGQWVVKIIIALIDTPFMYGIIWLIDRTKAAK